MKKYKVTLNEHQLRLIINCVEDVCRFMCGQVELSNATACLENAHEIHDIMRKEIYPLVVPELYQQYGLSASYGWSGMGCPNQYQKKFMAETYYLYRELRHQLTITPQHYVVRIVENRLKWKKYDTSTRT